MPPAAQAHPAQTNPAFPGPLTSGAVSELAAEIFRGRGGVLFRLMQRYRSYIAPMAAIVDMVPQGSTVLDVGCGGGLLLHILHRTNKLDPQGGSIGFDFSPGAIEIANAALASPLSTQLSAFSTSSASPPPLRFELRTVADGWPAGPDRLGGKFDVVTIIDVIHHVGAGLGTSGTPAARAAQQSVIEHACNALRPGGLLIYKDMCQRPRWRATANRMHDLVMAQQWINYCPIEDVERWGVTQSLESIARPRWSMWWYGHEALVMRKRA